MLGAAPCPCVCCTCDCCACFRVRSMPSHTLHADIPSCVACLFNHSLSKSLASILALWMTVCKAHKTENVSLTPVPALHCNCAIQPVELMPRQVRAEPKTLTGCSAHRFSTTADEFVEVCLLTAQSTVCRTLILCAFFPSEENCFSREHTSQSPWHSKSKKMEAKSEVPLCGTHVFCHLQSQLCAQPVSNQHLLQFL